MSSVFAFAVYDGAKQQTVASEVKVLPETDEQAVTYLDTPREAE